MILPSVTSAMALRHVIRAEAGQRLVLTNGCFDLLHPGHVRYLAESAKLGPLVVGIDSEASMARQGREMVNSALDRALTVEALASVRAVFIFDTLVPWIMALRPACYTKGGDYGARGGQVGDEQFKADQDKNVKTLNPDEHSALDAVGAEVTFMPSLAGYSSTRLRGSLADTRRLDLVENLRADVTFDAAGDHRWLVEIHRGGKFRASPGTSLRSALDTATKREMETGL